MVEALERDTGSKALWEILAHATDLPLVLVDVQGRVHFANDAAAEHVGMERAAQLVGRSLEDVCGADYARERMALVREASRSRGTVVVEGMTFGKWRRTLVRALDHGSTDGSCVLMVHLPASRYGRNPELVLGNPVRRARVDAPGVLGELSERELEVLRLISLGLSTAQIAKAMGRSVKTVEWHRVSLGDKLGVTNRVELARIAIRAGLVSVDDSGPDLDEPGTGE